MDKSLKSTKILITRVSKSKYEILKNAEAV